MRINQLLGLQLSKEGPVSPDDDHRNRSDSGAPWYPDESMCEQLSGNYSYCDWKGVTCCCRTTLGGQQGVEVPAEECEWCQEFPTKQNTVAELNLKGGGLTLVAASGNGSAAAAATAANATNATALGAQLFAELATLGRLGLTELQV